MCLVQYMPAKPVKYGLKAFLLCEAKTGYVLKWRLYTGDPMDSDQNYGLTYKVLRDLCKDFQGKGNILFTDRYYTSLQAYSDLKKLGIGACGTIQLDRSKLPKEFVKQIKSLKSEEIFYFKSVNNLLLSCWKDSNSVVVLSSCFGTGTSQRTRRKKRKEIEKERKKKRKQKRERNVESDNEEEEKDDKSDNEGDDSEGEEDEDEEDDSEGEEDEEEISVEVIKDVNIPMAIDQYNQYMAGVDIFDQKAVYYGIQLRSHRWYVKIFFHLLEISMINSYIIYQNVCKEANVKFMSHLEFRMDIIRDLLQDLRDELGLKSTKTKRTEAVKRKADEVLLETISQPLKQCKLEYIPKDFYSATNRKTCQLCDKNDFGTKKKVPQTFHWCSECKIYLCKGICFSKHSS